MQGSVGEFQKLQPRCCYDRRYSCPCRVRSHYPTVDIQSIWGGFADGLSDAQTQQLEDDVEDAAKMLVGDMDLFGETEGVGEA